MGEPDSAGGRTSREIITAFAAALRQLRAQAGQPTFRAMAAASGSISHTTMHEAAAGSRFPSWPTTREYVRACGGDESQWWGRWTEAEGKLRPHEGRVSIGEAVVTLESGNAETETAPSSAKRAVPIRGQEDRCHGTDHLMAVTERDRQRPIAPRSVSRRHRVVTHASAWIAGMVMGAGLVLGLGAPGGAAETAYLPPQDCPVTNAMAAGSPPVESAARVTPFSGAVQSVSFRDEASGIRWVERPAYDAQILSGIDVVLPVTSPVTEGNALIVTVMLTSTCPGRVAVTDTQGDQFHVVADETDTSRHRTMIVVALGIQPLSTADSIHVTYPHASKYHVAVDEFHGIKSVVAHAQAHGESGGVSFTTSVASPLTCAAGDFMVSAVGTNTGTAPTFAAPWTSLPVLKLSSYRLTTAYQAIAANGPCAATGTTTAQWGAAVAVFR